MTRDDQDRLLVAGGLAWLWFAGPAALVAFGTPVAGPSSGPLLYALSLPLLLALAALAMWRNVRIARIPLAVLALVLAAVALVLLESRVAGAVIAFGALAVAAGAARMRIPPERIERASAAGLLATLAETRVRGGSLDAADDPVLLGFLDAAAHLDRERTRILSAAWRAVDPAARRAAWEEVRVEASRSRRTAVLDELRREIELWGRAAGGSPWTWEWASMTDIDRSDVRRGAMPALLDAAAATLLRDRLSPDARETLIGPWEAATGTPAAEPSATVRAG